MTVPKQLAGLVESLSEEQLSTPYREGGWTARQVIHHLAAGIESSTSQTRIDGLTAVGDHLMETAKAVSFYSEN